MQDLERDLPNPGGRPRDRSSRLVNGAATGSAARACVPSIFARNGRDAIVMAGRWCRWTRRGRRWRIQLWPGCLLARRLVEAGVTFVEVGMGGWDTHQNNF